VFSNLNWYDMAFLLLLALFVFGDKLPQVLADLMRMLRNLRRTAQSATADLSRELGTDIRLEDLHPRAFVRRHLLSDEDREFLTRPMKELTDDLLMQTRGLRDEFDEVGGSIHATTRPSAPTPSRSAPWITPAEVSPAEVSPAEVSPAEVSPAEVSPAEVSPAEVPPAPDAPARPAYDDIT